MLELSYWGPGRRADYPRWRVVHSGVFPLLLEGGVTVGAACARRRVRAPHGAPPRALPPGDGRDGHPGVASRVAWHSRGATAASWHRPPTCSPAATRHSSTTASSSRPPVTEGRARRHPHPAESPRNHLPVVPGGTVPDHVDCATGWAWPDRVRKDINGSPPRVRASNHFLDRRHPPDFGNPQQPQDRPGHVDGKVGQIHRVNLRLCHPVPGADGHRGPLGWGRRPRKPSSTTRWAHGLTGPFSQPGDSGAVASRRKWQRRPVGLAMGTSNTTGMSIVCRTTPCCQRGTSSSRPSKARSPTCPRRGRLRRGRPGQRRR